MKKNSIIFVLLLISIFLGGIGLNLYNKYDNSEKDSIDDSQEDKIIHPCVKNKITEELVLGKWEFYDDDFNPKPYMIFNKDKTLITQGWGGAGNVVGTWGLQDDILTLDFYDNNEYWLGVGENFYNNYRNTGDLVAYDYETSVIKITFGYPYDSEWVNCPTDKYYINMASYHLYKVI